MELTIYTSYIYSSLINKQFLINNNSMHSKNLTFLNLQCVKAKIFILFINYIYILTTDIMHCNRYLIIGGIRIHSESMSPYITQSSG